jgi:glutaredoxin 3
MAQQQLDETIRSTPVVVFTQPGCPYCARIELLFTALDTKLGASKFVSAPGDSELRAALRVKVSATSVPQVFVGGQHLGGHDDLRQFIESASAAGSFGNKLDQAGALAEAAGSHAAAEADQTAAEEVRKWPQKIDWSKRSFCDAFMNGGNVPDSHAGGSTTFFGGLVAAVLVFVLATGLSSKTSTIRWTVVLPVLFGGFSGLQGVTNT